MKTFIFLFLISASSIIYANEFVPVNNGNDGFSDARTENINPGKAIDTQSNTPMSTSNRKTSNSNTSQRQYEYDKNSSGWKNKSSSKNKPFKYQNSSGSSGVSQVRKDMYKKSPSIPSSSSKKSVYTGSNTTAFKNSGSTLHEKMDKKDDNKYGNTMIFNCDGVYTDKPCSRFDNTFK